jgi:tetratricopeptide (TPR) repeat protein
MPRYCLVALAVLVLPCAAPALIAQQKSCGVGTDAAPAKRFEAANCYAERGDWLNANREIGLYRRAYPKSIDGTLLSARILVELHLVADANDVLERELAIYPHSVPLLMFYADLSERLGEPRRAEEQMLRCSEYAPKDPDVWARLGDYYLQNGNADAVNGYRKALQLRPADPRFEAGLATSFAVNNQQEKSRQIFELAVKRNQRLSKPYSVVEYRFAEFLRDQEKYEESLTFYDLAIKEDPNRSDFYYGRALSLMKLQRWDLAEKDANACLLDDTKKLAAMSLLLKIYQAQNKTDQAREWGDKLASASDADLAGKSSANQIAADLRQARILEHDGHYAEAAKVYEQVLEKHPEADAAWYGQGMCLANMGSLDTSETAFRKFLSTNPGSPNAHLYLGKVLLRKNQIIAARAEFLQARDLDPLMVDARLGIAASYIREGEYAVAIQELESAPRLPGSPTDAQLMLAEALYKNHEPARARAVLNAVLRRDPGNERARLMLSALGQGAPSSQAQ